MMHPVRDLLVIAASVAPLACMNAYASTRDHRVAEEDTVVMSYRQRPITPSFMHLAIYSMMEDCAGVRGDIRGVTWAVSDSIIQMRDGRRIQRVWGIWSSTKRQIVLDIGLYYLPGLVSHEILHDLYRGEIPDDTAIRCTLGVDGETIKLVMGIK